MLSQYNVVLDDFDRSQFRWQAAWRRVPAIVILLAAAIFYGQPAAGVLAAAAALSVGFGASRRIRDSRWLAMLVTMLLMAFSAWMGTLAGNYYSAILVATAVWGLICGFLTVFDEDIGWMAMQGVIALLVATAFPSLGLEALGRAALILVGGLTQAGSLLCLWRLAGMGRFGDENAPTTTANATPFPFQELCRRLGKSLVFSSSAVAYSIRVAVTLMIAVELDHLLKLKNGYWLPMTTIVVLKPDFFRTYTNGVQRSLGTLAGVVAASVIAVVLRPMIFSWWLWWRYSGSPRMPFKR